MTSERGIFILLFPLCDAMRSSPLLWILLFFSVSCAPRTPSPPPDHDLMENMTLDDGVEDVSSSEHSADEEQDPAEETRKRRLEALGFGIFNFSTLTATTCDFSSIEFRKRLHDAKDAVQDARDDVANEQSDVGGLEDQLDDAKEDGNERAVDRLRDAIEREQEELEDAEDVLDDAEVLLKKYTLIQLEIERYCLHLKAGG